MNITELVEDAHKNNGGTYQRVSKNNYRKVVFHSGYIVSRPNGIDNLPRLRSVTVEDFLDASSYSIISLWHDTKNQTWSIDVPLHREQLHVAHSLAITNNQKAIWDCKNGCEIRV